MIKCPYCGKSHFTQTGAASDLVYRPIEYKDGKIVSPFPQNNVRYYYHCLECDKNFDTLESIFDQQKNEPIQCDDTSYVDQINSVEDLRVEDIVEFYDDAEFRYVLSDEWGVTDEKKQEFVTDEDSNYYSFNEITKVWRQNKYGDYILIFIRE